MPGRHKSSTDRAGGARRLIGLAGIATLLFSLTLMVPADASSTDSVQLSLTGLVDNNNPAGGSQIGIHPGDSINFSASAAPTAKIKSIADTFVLGGVLNSLLGTTGFQVTANFANLPGGHSNTVVTDRSRLHFTFSRVGNYSFTYKAQKVSVNLLGQKTIATVSLDGNQAKKAGVELNASNQYVGTIVVAKNPPAGGISVQLPSVSVHPKVAGHQLPKITLPGVRLPTVRVPVPSLNKTKKSTGTTKGSGSGSTSGGTAAGADKNQLLPVPARVFGAGTTGGSAGGGGFAGTGLQGSSPVGNGQQLSLGSAGSSGGNGTSNALGSQAAQSKKAAQDLAANKPPSAQLPIVLAILAVIALALVAATYARLFLLRRAA